VRTHALVAIFRRNFVSYFSSPIGYVFICAFVLMSAFAAFWPNEFFNRNLANLDQLNAVVPWILLVFIPAITMGVWADERRQGTDELLLTLPATDFEVVIGKYLAALAIYTVSLLFSIPNLLVLEALGNPDYGLAFANYLGYWFAGAAMIAVGMAASFLTRNVTVGFILAAAFNAPLVFSASADTIVPWEGGARLVESLSIAAQLRDFARGIVALSGVVYFLSITLVALYLCMVLIGRRHWVVRVEAAPMSVHYAVRFVALLAIAIGLNVLVTRFDLPLDTTSERLSTLTRETKEIVAKLDDARPVVIEAYVSPDVPEQYVQVRANLISMLREMDRRGGDAVIVRVNDTRKYSREAAEAEELFGIGARQVADRAGGRFAIDEIYLGTAFMCGLDKVVVPFFDRGIPVEYEFVRSIATVSAQARKRVGVLSTDAQVFGGFDVQSMSSRPDQMIVSELRKQYDVVQVTGATLATERFDVLLAVQPSSLTADDMGAFIAAVRAGQPTVIFEDPFPYLFANVPATSEPRRPPSNNPFMGQQPPPEPKGDVSPLWQLLGLDFNAGAIVWQDYNPHPKIMEFEKEFVFVGDGSGSTEPINRSSAITKQLQELALLFAGSFAAQPGTAMQVEPLLRAGRETGVVAFDDIVQRNFFGGASLNPNRRYVATREPYLLAARIRGKTAAPPAEPGAPPPAPAEANVDAVVVADIDVLHSAFFGIRAQGDDPERPVALDFDNVNFVLNSIDALAGDDRFIAIRSRRPAHRTLTAVEGRVEAARQAANDERRKFEEGFETQKAAEEQKLKDEVAALNQRGGMDAVQMALEVAMAQQVGQHRLESHIERIQRERDREVERIERELAQEVLLVQNRYKLLAVGLPPIPPLLVAVATFVRRRSLEKIGVPAARLRRAA
jgi:ABC-2 type transport system permease protein